MSVIVNNLTKVYGEQKAIDHISFEVHKGEVMGFLGPNGAGKTTTMKILTCFMPQTSGDATVCGFDTKKDSIEIRRRIGYLPEHNPLYKDMYVREYLTFMAGVHKLDNPMEKVASIIERTGLGPEQKKLIGALSKGYRQRVGLAQAMIHNPEVLILDEPTSGLDPNQLVEIRRLIKELGEEKTVIFSTHIMQEVKAICDKAIIINKGVIVANDTIEFLQSHATEESNVIVEFAEAISPEILKKIKSVKHVKNLGQNRWKIATPLDIDIRKELFQFAVSNNLTMLELQREISSVEDVFQKLTK
ncbi:MAG: gliding motility-associated ABC transporter ATP-binding subunit GldA [Saprospiraceae bacterium]|nr:gliding motility-associated ABC transporter ATP-binding subunit GldA [Saprospiraceae bacterium]